MPFIYKKTGFNKKDLFLDGDKLSQYLPISKDCTDRLTKAFNNNKFKLNLSITKIKFDKTVLAIGYKKMIEEGRFKNQAELARALGVSRAWITIVMNELKKENKI